MPFYRIRLIKPLFQLFATPNQISEIRQGQSIKNQYPQILWNTQEKRCSPFCVVRVSHSSEELIIGSVLEPVICPMDTTESSPNDGGRVSSEMDEVARMERLF